MAFCMDRLRMTFCPHCGHEDGDEHDGRCPHLGEPFIAADIVAHTIEEGGLWLKGYAHNWVVAVHQDGRVFDRVLQLIMRRLFRGTLTREQMEHIDNVVNGRWQPDPLSMGAAPIPPPSGTKPATQDIYSPTPPAPPQHGNLHISVPKQPTVGSFPSRATRSHQDWRAPRNDR